MQGVFFDYKTLIKYRINKRSLPDEMSQYLVYYLRLFIMKKETEKSDINPNQTKTS